MNWYEFKIGDKVKIIKINSMCNNQPAGVCCGEYLNKIGTIKFIYGNTEQERRHTRVKEGRIYNIDIENFSNCWFQKECLELIKDEMA